MPRVETIVLLVLLAAAVAYHYAFCLVPSLRYLKARPAAFALGLFAYLIVVAPPILEALVIDLDRAASTAYVVIAVVVLTIAGFRPYAFVRGTGGPRSER